MNGKRGRDEEPITIGLVSDDDDDEDAAPDDVDMTLIPSAGVPAVDASVALPSIPPAVATILAPAAPTKSKSPRKSPPAASAGAASPTITAAASTSPATSPKLTKAEKAERAAQRLREREQKAAAKAELKLDNALAKVVQRACKGAHAEEEIHVILDGALNHPRYAKLTEGLTEHKLSYSFAHASAAATASSAAAAYAASAAVAATAGIPASACSVIPKSIVFHRRQAPSVVAQIRARKRQRGAPAAEWKTFENEAKECARHSAEVDQQSSDIVDELPPPQPIRTIVTLLDGAEFLSLYALGMLQATIDQWLMICTDVHADNTLLLLVHGLYRLVQVEANQALQQRRDAAAQGSPTKSSPSRAKLKPLKKLTDVDALLARIWFQTKGKVRFQMADSLDECFEWLISLTTTLSKAPYKESDNVLTLVNTARTDVREKLQLLRCACLRFAAPSLICFSLVVVRDFLQRMRGGDDFALRPIMVRASPSDDSDDEAGSSVQQRRAAAKSTMAETWRLYLMQIPRMSERIALTITRAYPSFRRLYVAYAACATDKQRDGLVADLQVGGGGAAAAAGVPGARAQRIGPALSKALYQAIWLQNEAVVPQQPGEPAGSP